MKNIVILGGGFGGVRTALDLGRNITKHQLQKEYEVILVDKNNEHTFTPPLYTIPTLSPQNFSDETAKNLVTFPFKELFKDLPIRFIKDEIEHLDLEQGVVHLHRSKLSYEYLVLALGAESNYFDIPGLADSAFSFKSMNDALRLRQKIHDLFEHKGKELRVVIGGGGPTGVELAARIRYELGISVTIVEALPSILPGFQTDFIQRITDRLKNLGVGILVNSPIARADKDTLFISNGVMVPFDILIWTGGVKAVGLAQEMPLKREKRGRMEVESVLECLPNGTDLRVYGKIYAIGDIACFYDPITKQPMPQVARTAIEQGVIAAKNIINCIEKECNPTNVHAPPLSLCDSFRWPLWHRSNRF